MAQTQCPHLLRQAGFMAARAWAESLAATDEDAGAARAVAGVARTFLIAELLAGAVHFAARLGLVRTGLTLVELPVDDAMEDVGTRIKAEDVIGEIDAAGRFGFDGLNVGFHDDHHYSFAAAV